MDNTSVALSEAGLVELAAVIGHLSIGTGNGVADFNATQLVRHSAQHRDAKTDVPWLATVGYGELRADEELEESPVFPVRPPALGPRRCRLATPRIKSPSFGFLRLTGSAE